VATNDVFDTPSLLDANVRAQMIKWANNTRVFSDGYDAFAGVPNIYALHLTHSVIQGYTVDIEWSNGTFSNNVYSNFYTGPVETEAVDFGDTSVPLYNLTWSNNTFLSDYNNLSFWKQLSSINGNGNAGSGGTSLVYGGDGVTWLNFVHNSVYTLVGGGVNPQVLLGEIANITDNVFYNNETVCYSSLPFASDVISAPPPNSDVYVEGNWFLNLNNMTASIVISEGSGTYTIQDNHYFFAPLPIQNTIFGKNNPTTDFSTMWKYTSPTYPTGTDPVPVPIYSLQAQNGGHLVLGSNTQLIYNTTNKNYASGENGNNANLTAWQYGIVPDTSITGSQLYLGYNVGLQGGPQPNFEWKGYNYSESVEPTYIQVGVNSSKAPSIGLQFQGIAGALYDIEIFNNGSLISSYQESATSLGVLNATYNPATMPLDPIFYVEYVGSGVVPPPVVPPLVPTVPHVLFGIPYLNVIVLFGGIALASEEFFRTQAKGKEKKYSYTGIFVGIMIAGIGLMSVL
jgi:hypothetical protein